MNCLPIASRELRVAARKRGTFRVRVAAALTALLIGLVRSFAVYLAPELEVLTPYLLMVLVLLIRPQGLFARPEARRI